ncbi:MAG: HAMP domain-containing protein, partial [Ignavibacteriae bacterium]|nr:HAMP domain-containing protein [Ignavibacteriota bacterium]
MKFTIGKKLALGFGFATLILLAFGLFGIKVLNEFKEDITGVESNQNEILIAEKLKIDAVSILDLITDASLTKDESVINDEAKPKYLETKKGIEELIKLNTDDKELAEKLEKLNKKLDELFVTGKRMFDAYNIDWNLGNLNMEDFDKIAETFIEDVDTIADAKIMVGKNSILEMKSMSDSSMFLSLIFLSFSIITSIVIAFFTSKKITVPVNKLNKAALQISKKDYNVDLEVSSNDEIGELAASFNAMIDTIIIQNGYLDNLPTPIMVIDNNFEIEYMNKKGAEVIGVDQKSLSGKKCYDQFKTGHCNTEKCACSQAMKKDGVVTEETIAKPQGKDIPIMYTGGPIKNKKGEIIGAIEYIADITDLKERENYLKRSTDVILGAMGKFSQGDLTVNIIAENQNDDIGKLFNGFNSSVLKINEALNQVMETVQATASAAHQISSSAEELAAGSQEQSSQTSEVATAVEQMVATITQTTQHVLQTNQAAKESGDLAKGGQNVIQATINGMKKIEEVVRNSSKTILELGESSGQIGEIIQVINDIADQTNLLALNAAIEAARAGEQGRGFAVVADEVRKLAERTTSATNEIEAMVNKIQKDSQNAVNSIKLGNDEVSRGMGEATKAGESMTKIVHSSNVVVEISTQVAAASEEQSATVEQISR